MTCVKLQSHSRSLVFVYISGSCLLGILCIVISPCPALDRDGLTCLQYPQGGTNHSSARALPVRLLHPQEARKYIT